MNPPSFSEEKLTAYALNELSPAERREVEAELTKNPELQAELKSIQALALQLRQELSLEAGDFEKSPRETHRSHTSDKSHPSYSSDKTPEPAEGKIISFRKHPWFYTSGLLAVAACAALMFLPSLSLNIQSAQKLDRVALKENKPSAEITEESVSVSTQPMHQLAEAPAPAEEVTDQPMQVDGLAAGEAEVPETESAKPQKRITTFAARGELDVVSDSSVYEIASSPLPARSQEKSEAAPVDNQSSISGIGIKGNASLRDLNAGKNYAMQEYKKSPAPVSAPSAAPAPSTTMAGAGTLRGNNAYAGVTSVTGGAVNLPGKPTSAGFVGKDLYYDSWGGARSDDLRSGDLQESQALAKELRSDYLARRERLEKLNTMSAEDLEKALPVLGEEPHAIRDAKNSIQREEALLASLKKSNETGKDTQVAASKARINELRGQIDTATEQIRKGFAADLEVSRTKLENKEREVARMQAYFRKLKTAPASGESYTPITDNAFLRVADQALSTFSIDVDTGAYTNLRRFLNQGQLPPPNAVRIEELVNYFNYNYPQPKGADPFSVNTEVAKAPWNNDHLLVRIGLQGKTVAAVDRPAANLVFLIDVSGSMSDANKLPLVIDSMKLLVQKLKPEDRVGIAVYAGNSGMVLPSTSVSHRGEILEALSNLQAGGSTNGAMGIQLAYDMAKAHFIEGGINRVILCTDGDFNVGVTNREDLIKLIEEKAKSKVFLSVFGFGMGNLQDATLEQLANKGNGNYGYIDNPKEAKRVFVDQLGGTLQTIAKDVKIQVEFNPAVVSSYRLIGYENRMLAAKDFNDDKKDAGEIGAGHRVTALYEIVPVGVKEDAPSIDPLKYQKPAPVEYAGDKSEIMNVKLRYKQPEGDTSKLLEHPVKNENILSFTAQKSGWFRSAPAVASDDFQFAAGVAAFGMILRDSPYKGETNFDLVLQLAGKGSADKQEDRAEFITLVKKARTLFKDDPKAKE